MRSSRHIALRHLRWQNTSLHTGAEAPSASAGSGRRWHRGIHVFFFLRIRFGALVDFFSASLALTCFAFPAWMILSGVGETRLIPRRTRLMVVLMAYSREIRRAMPSAMFSIDPDPEVPGSRLSVPWCCPEPMPTATGDCDGKCHQHETHTWWVLSFTDLAFTAYIIVFTFLVQHTRDNLVQSV